MTELEEFLAEISVFQVSDAELHLYLGTFQEPAATVIVIRGQRIGNPTRVPPISKENLEQRYKNCNLRISTIFPKIRLLLGIFGLIPLTSIDEDDDQDEEEEEYFILTKKWNEEEDQRDDFILPITSGIRDIVEDPAKNPEIIQSLANLLGNEDRSNRQKTLSEMVAQNDQNVNCLLSIMLMIRPEITSAIIRELGRQSTMIRSILEQCHALIQTEDKAYVHFGFGYLSQFDNKGLQNSEYYKKLQINFARYQNQPHDYRLLNLLSKLKEHDREAAEAFDLWYFFSNFEELQFEMEAFSNQATPSNINKKALRSAIVDIIQFAETSQNLKHFGLAIALSSLFDNYHGFHLYSELNHSFQHIRQRVLSQFHLWVEIGKKENITKVLGYFLALIPILELNAENGDRSEIHIIWQQEHPLIMHFPKLFEKIWKDDDLTIKILYHSTQINNDILSHLIDSQELDIDVEGLPLVKRTLINSLLEDIEEEVIEATSQTIEDENLKYIAKNTQLLQQLERTALIVSKNIVREIAENIIARNEEIIHLKGYIRMVARNAKEILNGYFSELSNLVLQLLDIKYVNMRIKEIIISILVPWQNITGAFPNDAQQQFIDTFKIIFQGEIENFDLESSKPLGVETITNCYKITNGEIPKFIESNIQFSFTKPVWDQLARHYLALGIQRPKREEIAKSKLKEVPSYLTRDVLGQIALVNQTISYCERNGFRPALENLIISNMYKRGWNMERGLERMLPSLFGSITPRLRSYFSAYLVIDQGEISSDILKWARDVEDYLLRDRILRELDRYGTADMWVVIANAYHPDIQRGAIKALKETRMNATERSKTTLELLTSSRENVQELGISWLKEFGVQQDDLLALINIDNEDINHIILEYLSEQVQHYTDIHQEAIFERILKNIWRTNSTKINSEVLSKLSSALTNHELKNRLKENIMELLESPNKGKIGLAVSTLAALEV